MKKQKYSPEEKEKREEIDEKFEAMDDAFLKGMQHRIRHGFYSIALLVAGTATGYMLQMAEIIPQWMQNINILVWVAITYAYYKTHDKQADKIVHTARDAFRESLKAKLPAGTHLEIHSRSSWAIKKDILKKQEE